MEKAVFGAGCFWCLEAIFQRLKGVENVKPGYTGGKIINPTYQEVCSGTTGHVEIVYLDYNPTIISYLELLEVFWTTHDPTTLNKQDNDVGSQYRSAIFYTNDEQKRLSEDAKMKLDKLDVWVNPIVTEINPLNEIYVAENYHHNYFNQNNSQSYCKLVIQPKIEKLNLFLKTKKDGGNVKLNF